VRRRAEVIEKGRRKRRSSREKKKPSRNRLKIEYPIILQTEEAAITTLLFVVIH